MKIGIRLYTMIAFIVIIAINTIVSCENIDETVMIEERNRELPDNIVEILSDETYQRFIVRENEIKNFVDQIPQELLDIILIEYDNYMEGKVVDENKIKKIFDSNYPNIDIFDKFECYFNDRLCLEEKYDLINMKNSHKRLLHKSTIYYFEPNSSKFKKLFKAQNNDLNSQMLKSTPDYSEAWEDPYEDPYEADECVDCESDALDAWDDCDATNGFTQAGAIMTFRFSPFVGVLMAIGGFMVHDNCGDDVSTELDDCYSYNQCPGFY